MKRGGNHRSTIHIGAASTVSLRSVRPFSSLVEKAFPSTSICDLVVDRTSDSTSYCCSLYSDASLITFLALLLLPVLRSRTIYTRSSNIFLLSPLLCHSFSRLRQLRPQPSCDYPKRPNSKNTAPFQANRNRHISISVLATTIAQETF